ncbi:MAG TPA: NAD(P)H-dependent oxidoreductase subunit E [Cyanobacteria bacterium UBA8530]|nr:NAD(P)H-dependent oxidoreductase subunit E [Cyanobacteria bacterium UBA8530]
MKETEKKPVHKFERVCEILEGYSRDPAKLIPILQAVQEEYRYLPEEVLAYIATSVGISPAKVYGVATFFAHFTLEPKGKYIIRICDGTACHVKKSIPILEALQKKLGLDDQRKTSADMLFTLETVSCLGACGLAPVMVINEEVHGQMTPESTLAVLEGILKEEGKC